MIFLTPSGKELFFITVASWTRNSNGDEKVHKRRKEIY